MCTVGTPQGSGGFPILQALVLVCLLPLAGCGGDPFGPESGDLSDARSDWEAADIRNYVFQFWASCVFCPRTPWKFRLWAGRSAT